MPRKTVFWAFHAIRFIFNGQKTLAFSLYLFHLQHGCAWGLTAVNPPTLESSQSIAFTLWFLQLYEIWQIVFFRVKTQWDLHAKGTWNIDDRTEKAHPNPHLAYKNISPSLCSSPSRVGDQVTFSQMKDVFPLALLLHYANLVFFPLFSCTAWYVIGSLLQHKWLREIFLFIFNICALVRKHRGKTI